MQALLRKDSYRRITMTALPLSNPPFSSPIHININMQSPFSYTDSYSSSPGGMDFFFYGSPPPVYDNLCDLDRASPFGVPEVVSDVSSFPNSFTSSPYTVPTMNDYGHVYEAVPMATSVPSSASSSCGSSCGGNWNQADELSMPHNVLSGSFDDSDSSQSKPVKPFGCDNCGKSFTRFADLKRHQSSVHFPVFRNCPVEHCSRKGSNGFPRQDHLVEHLRSYHHMDVPKRRALKRSSKDA